MMVKKRSKRPGPKSSKVDNSDDDQSNEEDESAHKNKTSDKETATTSRNTRAVGKRKASKDANDSEEPEPSVSSPIADEVEKESAKKDSEDEGGTADDDPLGAAAEVVDNDPLGEANVAEADKPEDDLLVELEAGAEVDAAADVEQEAKTVMPVLRLVPLSTLLKPEVLVKPKQPARPLRKLAPKPRKSVIEISSDESEPELIDSSSESSDDDEVLAKKKKRGRDGGSSKENNSTNNKLSNGSNKKALKNAKDLFINLAKMPNNINKLMKSYRVDQSQIESWSDNDDFENMITTSKIDRVALDKAKDDVIKQSLAQPEPEGKKKSQAKKSQKVLVEEEEEVNSSASSSKSEDEEVRPTSRRPQRTSALKAKIETKKLIKSAQKVTSSESSEDDDEDEKKLVKARVVRKGPSAKTSKTFMKTHLATISDDSSDEPILKKTTSKVSPESESDVSLRTARKEQSATTSKSFRKTISDDSSDEPIAKKAPKKAASKGSSESESEFDKLMSKKPPTKSKDKKKKAKESNSSSDEKKVFKPKKKVKDDHGKEKVKKSRRDKSSSSEEEKEVPARSNRAKKTKEPEPARTTRSRKGPAPETSSMKGKKGHTNELKITIKLNKKGSGDSESDKQSNDSDSDASPIGKKKSSKKKAKSLESSLSDDDQALEPIRLGEKPPGTRESSDTEAAESSTSVAADDPPETVLESEIPAEEISPILDQKFRNRNKFQKNSAFETLKQKIELRKSKRKASTDEDHAKKPLKRESRRNQNGTNAKEKSEKNNNHKDDPDDDDDELSIKAKKLAAKRKRLLSSSDEEQKNGDSKSKKKKMNSNDDSELEAGTDDDKPKGSEDAGSNSEDEQPKPKKKRKPANSSSEEYDEDDEEDDDDDEQPKNRKTARSSDNSDDDDLNETEKNRPKNKRHKRIKKVASSDEDGEENGDKSKTGRKNIRKMMRADKLDVSTKEAGKIERDRKQRIEERQKFYNQFYDERPEEAKEITKLVLDFDPETKKSLLQVDKKLVKKLKPHQANGVKFMWDACFESLDRCEKDLGSGCILAHCMGLGKTLQVITLVHTLIKNQDKTGILRVLVVCPLSTVLNWVNEFNIWLKDVEGREDIYVYEINKLKQNVDRANKLMEWHNDGGIMILSYDMFRNLSNDTGRLRKKIKESLQTSLVDPGPDLVICDEGHLLKNEKTSISKAMMKLRTLRRIVLTGTPLQNNLKEYYCMVQFVKPNLLGKYQEYLNRFVNPITNGQYTDSTEYDIQVMRRRAHVLHKMLDGCVQRRDYSVLAPFLPPKHEYVISIQLTPMQVKLYKYYMENRSRSNDENAGRKGSILFQDFQNLQRIWTAPLVLRYNSNRYEIEQQKKRDLESEDESEGSLKDFIDDSESAKSTSCSSSDDRSDGDGSINSDEPKKGKKKKKKSFAQPRRTRAKAADFPSDHEAEAAAEVAAAKVENPTEWWMQVCPEEELNNLQHSSKLMLLMSIIEECEAIGDKLLVFSQSLYSLDVIEHFLNHIDEQTQQNAAAAPFTGSWSLGQDYFRLDGSTPVEQRNSACKHFNSPSNPRSRLFLISTRAGGLGINLVAANRVIVFDVSWNPSHDIQSIFRVYRFGQTKPCYVYRFLALGTMEEKIYERQVTKQAISKRVIDEQQIDRHYNQNDLQELYKYELEPDDERILPILPKDRLFANMLKKYEDMIYKYHEHDTLLENKEEETLGEDERKQAWEEFEQEKNRPQFAAQQFLMQQQQQQQQRGIGPVTSNNIFGIRTDVLLKLLSMKARLDNPNMTDGSVKQAIPLLMQELYRQMDRGELTLYQQLLALSSSLEVPPNYGGQFRVNENMMQQTYNSMNSLPTTSSAASAGPSMLQRAQLMERQQQLFRYAQQQRQNQALVQQLKRKSPPRVDGSVIEID